MVGPPVVVVPVVDVDDMVVAVVVVLVSVVVVACVERADRGGLSDCCGLPACGGGAGS